MAIDHTGRFGAEMVEITTQHWCERCRWRQSPARVRLAAVVEPLCRQKISVDETGKDHSYEKGSAEAGDPSAGSAYEIAKLGGDRSGFREGNPASPAVMASWDLSALKPAQQRSFVGASAVWQPPVMASDPVGKEYSKLFAKL